MISVGPAKILVVEDAAEFAQLITAAIRKDGHEVSTASTIEAAREHLRSMPPDVVILDLTLPDGDGLDLCQEVRSSTDAFVLMLTGRDDEVDKLLGFRLGADDYMTKPFSPRELAARVAALIGRSRSRSADQPARSRVVGDVKVDIDKRSVEIAGQATDLTKIEFDLLLALSQRPGAVLSRAQLLTAVWGDNYVGDDHVVDVHIANLRKKIDIVGDGSSRVRTVRGVGYAMSV
jgi:DNA-binding response OmpR family regulator